MRFRLEKKQENLHAYSTSGFLESLKRVLNTGKDIKYMINTSPKRFNSQAEEESFQIQAELSRSNAILHEVMIPPR